MNKINMLASTLALTAATTIGCSAEKEPMPQPTTSTIETTIPSTTIEPTSTTTVVDEYDYQAKYDAEAELEAIEPERLNPFIHYIKQNGVVLDWSEGSRYRVVAEKDDVVYTAELDFGATPPVTPEALADTQPSFIQIYARFPGEENAGRVITDGTAAYEGQDEYARLPNGKVDTLYGDFEPTLAENFDFSDHQGLIDIQAQQLRVSGAFAQQLYSSAVDAVLNQQ